MSEDIDNIGNERLLAFIGLFVGIGAGFLVVLSQKLDGIEFFIGITLGGIRSIFFILENLGVHFKRKGYDLLKGLTTGGAVSFILGTIIISIS